MWTYRSPPIFTMRYIDLKNEIRDLGFEEDQIFQEYPSIFRTAITRACKLIASLVKAPIGRLDLDLSASLGTSETEIEEGSTANPIQINGESVTAVRLNIVAYGNTRYYFDGTAWHELGRYDLDVLTQDADGNSMFDAIERIVIDNGSTTRTFLRYDMEEDHVLVIDSAISEDFIVFYKERILPITEDTLDEYNVQVVYPCEPLVALLAAHYVWLDDDERKAVMYWNEFDQLRQEIEAKYFKPKARIIGGI